MATRFVAVQVTSEPTTIPLYRLSAILTGKAVVIADFSCMTTHNCSDYSKISCICYELYATPQTNSLIFKERKVAVHKMYPIPGTFPQHPMGKLIRTPLRGITPFPPYPTNRTKGKIF